jgi:CheY-like chemotaxis protein/signal transduction histidine kinase
VRVPGFLRSASTIVSALAILAGAAGIVGFTWFAAGRTIAAQRDEAVLRMNATATGLANTYADQINRQILALDQTLDSMAQVYETDPDHFDLVTLNGRARVLTGISHDMFLADEAGVIRQSSVPDIIGQSAAELDIFRDAVQRAKDGSKPGSKLVLGGVSINPIMRQWHLDAARAVHHQDGSFAGMINADYRISAINDVFTADAPPGNGFAALIGMTDGKLRAGPGIAEGSSETSIADTPMFAAVEAADSGLWVGPSSSDSVLRVHAFRRLPGRDLAVVAGIDQQEAMQLVLIWQRQARIFAGTISGLTMLIAAMLLRFVGASQRRAERAREDLALLAAADARADVSRAQTDAVTRRLQATFAAISDGVAIFDAHLNLVEWNALFPERSGVNASLIRTGMPMEAVLRAQAEGGYFGETADVEADVERRAALLRAGNFGASQTFQAEGRVIELRCQPLAEGGFVALYTDVTQGRQARHALRDLRDALLREQSSRMRFLRVISHELRLRIATLMQVLPGVTASGLPEDQTGWLIDQVRRVGISLAGLAADTVEVPRMQAGTLQTRPALTAVRPLLQDSVDTIQLAAQEHGITPYLILNESAPAELIADPNRIRQIVTLLLSEALRFASPDTMWLLVEGGEDEHADKIALRLIVRCLGSPLPDAVRATVFPTLDAISVSAPPEVGEPRTTTGLGPAIAQYLTTLMGGYLHCEAWSTVDGRTGNDFVLTLPAELLPGQRGRSPGQIPEQGRMLPRTRILMAGAPNGLRMAAVTMLRRDAHMVDPVATGEEAVQSLRLIPYDIAFLDTDLPDMTVATMMGVIREMSGPGRIVPVVAIAPSRDEIEEQTWRDAGVDDILAVNPTPDDFAAAIRRHVWLNRSVGPDVVFMPGLDDEAEDGIPVLAIQRIAELKANIPAEALLDMAEECIADLFHRLPALRRALAAGVPGAITAQAHAMVGMAGGYGMAVLEARLRAILTASRANRLDTIDGAADVIEADLTRAASVLRRTLRAVGSGVPT